MCTLQQVHSFYLISFRITKVLLQSWSACHYLRKLEPAWCRILFYCIYIHSMVQFMQQFKSFHLFYKEPHCNKSQFPANKAGFNLVSECFHTGGWTGDISKNPSSWAKSLCNTVCDALVLHELEQHKGVFLVFFFLNARHVALRA